MSSAKEHYDVVVAGGGHNGLVAAAYLARAGLSVLVLERLAHVGGAAVSAQPFRGHEARVSPYSYLVSLMPDQPGRGPRPRPRGSPRARRRRTPRRSATASRRPARRAARGRRPRASFEALTGGTDEYDAWREFHADVTDLAHAVAPTLLEPLPTERDRPRPGRHRHLARLRHQPARRHDRGAVRRRHGPRGRRRPTPDRHVRRRCTTRRWPRTAASSTTRSATGPASGGCPSAAWAPSPTRWPGAAREAGAEILTVGRRQRDPRRRRRPPRSSFHDGMSSHTVGARFALANVAPWVLQILLGEPDDPETKPQGAQLKLDLLLDRLPRLRSGVDPDRRLRRHPARGRGLRPAREGVRRGRGRPGAVAVPGRLDCPSLTDPSVLGSSADGPAHADATSACTPRPRSSTATTGPTAKERAVAGALAAINEHLVGADRVLPRPRRRRQPVPRGPDPAGRRGRPGDARRPHLPRRPGLAVGPQPRPARHPRPAVGRPDRRRLGAGLRLRSPPRRRRLRASAATTPPRPSSPTAEGDRDLVGGRLPDFSPRSPAGNVAVASQRAPLAQLAEQLTLNQRVRGSSP